MGDLELLEVKEGWFARTPDSRGASFGRTPEEAVAAWERSEAGFQAALARYWLMVRGDAPAQEHTPGENWRAEHQRPPRDSDAEGDGVS